MDYIELCIVQHINMVICIIRATEGGMKNTCNWVHEQWSTYLFVSVWSGLSKTNKCGVIPKLLLTRKLG